MAAVDKKGKRKRRLAWMLLPAVWVLLAGVAGVLADEIIFKNGRSIEGIVRQETDTHVFVDLGVGSMKISKSRVERIVRKREGGRGDIEDRWREKYFLHRRYVPPSMRGLADALRTLGDKRREAVAAQRTLDQAAATQREIEQRRSELRAELMEVSRALVDARPEDNPVAYNGLVRRSNSLKASITLLNDRLDAFDDRLASALGKISGYMESVMGVEGQVADAMDADSEEALLAEEADFLDKAAERLAVYGAEFNELSVPTESMNGGTLVQCVVNGDTAGTFIVDTGAAIVSLSEAFARKAGVPTEDAPVVNLVVADGRKVQGRGVVLDSLALGEARVEKVRAVVLPSAVRESIDGLLGMTFLKHFIMRLDGNTGKLLLRRFVPES